MPYRVITTPGTPLWADHQRTFKKGVVARGAEFRAVNTVTDGGLLMLKTDEVEYISKETGILETGDGWIEHKNCESVTSVTTDPGDVPPPFVPFGPTIMEAGAALDVLIRFIKARL